MCIAALTEADRRLITIPIKPYRALLLLPPWRNPHAILAGLMRAGRCIYFYALTPEDADLEIFLQHMVRALQEIDPQFGPHTQTALAQPGSQPVDLAKAMLKDIKSANPQPGYLFLDEFDHLSPTDNIETFFTYCLAHLPSGVQLILNGRQLAAHPWLRFVRFDEAVWFGEPPDQAGEMPVSTGVERPHLAVYGFGAGQVVINGGVVDVWEGPLVQHLFYYLNDHPMVTRDDIFKTFWPDLPIRDATNVFHVTKRKITERLGYELTSYASGFYIPSGQLDVEYDVTRFEETIRQARQASPEGAFALWQRAIHLYRFPFLQNKDMPWIKERREALKLMYVEALVEVGRCAAAQGDWAQAISYYLRALRDMPEREDLHRDVMTLYARSGEREKTIRQYQALYDVLERTLHITPSRATCQLYQQLTTEAGDER